MVGRKSAGTPPPAVVSLRPIATPLSLGFLALAVTSFLVSGLELSWASPARQAHTVALLVLVFVVPLQAISTVFGFLARDPAAAAGMGVMTGTWAAFGTATLMSTPGSTSRGLGLLLCAAAMSLVVPAAAATLSKPLAGVVLALAAARFAVSGAFELTGSTTAGHVAGWLGLAVFALATYAALAFELEGATGRAIVPVGRRVPRHAAVDEADREPGVRATL